MNDSDVPPEIPQSFPPADEPAIEPENTEKPFIYWLKKLLACNPFYLVSAALLLYGFYRVSIDPNFLHGEIAQLFFNLGSLQFYEALVVVTAIFLARRCIWYDSTLLVGLENLLLLVPFILVSQAGLIHTAWVWGMCAAAGVLALGRIGSTKRFIAELNFPRRLVGLGLLVLLINAALPVVYRTLHEYKVGKLPTTGAAFWTNEYVWLLLFPALCALALALPSRRDTGDLLPQRGWLPSGFFALWLTGTAVHLYCLGYVYDFSLRLDLVIPAIWVCLWVLYVQVTPVLRRRYPDWDGALLIPPLAAAFLGMTEPNNSVFLVLTLCNAAVYAAIHFYHRDNRLALTLCFVALVALVAGLPEEWGRHVVSDFTRAKSFGGSVAFLLLAWAAWSTSPKLGTIGAIVSATVVCALGHNPNTPHWATQAAVIFLLLHSLRWEDAEHQGAAFARVAVALTWVVHAWIWVSLSKVGWTIAALAVPVLCSYLAARWLRGSWGPWAIPVATGLVLLAGPSNFAAGQVTSIPVGLVAVIGSFLLFGVGTLAATTRHRWSQFKVQSSRRLNQPSGRIL
jgi:hypothetical protein